MKDPNTTSVIAQQSTLNNEDSIVKDAKRYDAPLRPPEVTDNSRKARLSPIFAIIFAGIALLSDGYQNNVLTMNNLLLKVIYPQDYTSTVSTRVSNAILVGDIIGMLSIGWVCDRFGRKTGLIISTFLLVIGSALAAGSSGLTIAGLFWMMVSIMILRY